MNSSPVLLRIVRQVTRSPTHRTSLGCSDTRTDSSTLQCVAITAMRCSIIAFCISIFRATVSSRCSTNIRASRMYMCTVPRSRCACALSCACLNSTSSRMSRFRSSAIRLFIGQRQVHHPRHLGAMASSVTTAFVRWFWVRRLWQNEAKCRYAARGARRAYRGGTQHASSAAVGASTTGHRESRYGYLVCPMIVVRPQPCSCSFSLGCRRRSVLSTYLLVSTMESVRRACVALFLTPDPTGVGTQREVAAPKQAPQCGVADRAE